MLPSHDWHFPLPRTHTGLLLGNATMGVMVWGSGNQLNLTLNRADFWDHRGGKPWTPAMNYRSIRALLEAGDEPALRAIFEGEPPPAGQPRRPSLLPLGRLELVFADELQLETGTLEFGTGLVSVTLRDQRQRRHIIQLSLAMNRQLLAVKLPVPVREIRRVPAWEFVGEYLKSISFPEPVLLADGWEQARPNDPAINVGYRQEKALLWVSVDYGRQKVARALAQGCRQGWTTARRRSAAWWESYWRDVPAVEVPNPRLQFIYQYGMYKLARLPLLAGCFNASG